MLGMKRTLETGAAAQGGAVETTIEQQRRGETAMRCARVIFRRRSLGLMDFEMNGLRYIHGSALYTHAVYSTRRKRACSSGVSLNT